MLSPYTSPPRFFSVMPRSDEHLKDAVPTQKQEWVTPKISLMMVEDVRGKAFNTTETVPFNTFGPS
jgi:hypothetical protein